MMLAPQPAPVERTLNPDPQHRQRNIAEIQIASTLENNHDTELQVVIPPLKRTFHPTLSLQLNVTSPSLLSSPSSLTNACFQAVSGRQECFLLLRVKLPDEVFIDPDELDGKWGGKTRNRYWSRGRMESSVGGDMDIEEIGSGGVYDWLITPEKIDIERPVFTSNEDNIEPAGPGTKGGSAIAQSGGSVLDVMLPLRHKQKQEQRLDQDQEHGIPDELETEFLSLDIPLHGRYLAPSDDGEVEITVLSAEATDNGEAIPQGGSLHGMVGCASQSFVPQEIDVSRVFPPLQQYLANQPNTRYTHSLSSSFQRLEIPSPITLTLPTGHPSHQFPVELGTTLVIWVGCAYLLRKVWLLWGRASAALVARRKRGLSDGQAEGKKDR